MTLQKRVEELNEQVARAGSVPLLTNQLSIDKELREEVRLLYSLIFGKQLSGCLNCMADAAFEIVRSKDMVEKSPFEYLLAAGDLLYDSATMDSSKAMSNANISEELALYHLATNPACKERFIRLPQDWQERVEAYKHRMAAASEEVKENIAPKPRAKRTTKKSTENNDK